MRRATIVIGVLALIAGCSQAAENAEENGAANAAASKKPKVAYCFFKDAETKGWAAKRDSTGDLVVTGKAYRSDSRYKAVLGEAKISGTSAEISPSIVLNDAAFGAPDDWWDVSKTIPNSSAIDTVNVTCGRKTLASLSVQRKK